MNIQIQNSNRILVLLSNIAYKYLISYNFEIHLLITSDYSQTIKTTKCLFHHQT